HGTWGQRQHIARVTCERSRAADRQRIDRARAAREGQRQVAHGERIRVRKPGGFFNLGAEDVPRIVIGPGSVVGGTLNFARPVKVYAWAKATIGPVQDATAVKHSGERPPD